MLRAFYFVLEGQGVAQGLQFFPSARVAVLFVQREEVRFLALGHRAVIWICG